MTATAVILKRGRLIHATRDLRVTVCGKPCDAARLVADGVPDCKPCLKALLDDNR